MKSAFIWSFAGKYAALAINTLSILIIARLLTPEQIGTFSIGAALLALMHAFRDFGITQFLIREKELTREKIEASLMVVWVSCITLSLILLGSASSITSFYQNVTLHTILQLLSINLLLIPFGLIAQITLQRNLQFKRLAVVYSVSALSNFIIAITFIFLDFGSVSLALAAIASQLATIVSIRILSPLPETYSPSLKGVKAILPFIGSIGTSNILNRLSTEAQPLIIGKILSETAVAFFDKGFAIIKLMDQSVFNAIRNVILPLFSIFKHQQDDFREKYLELCLVSVTLAWPFLFACGLFSELIVNILFGDQWHEVSKLVPYICFTAALYNISRYFNEFLISQGHEKYVLKTNITLLTIRLAIILIFASYGLLILVQALTTIGFIRTIVTSYYLKKLVDIQYLSLIKMIIKSLVVLIISMTPFLYYKFTTLYVDYLSILPWVIISLPFWFLALKITKNPLLSYINNTK